MSEPPPFIRRMAYQRPQFRQYSRLRRFWLRNSYEIICYVIVVLGIAIVLRPDMVNRNSEQAVKWMFLTLVCLLGARFVAPWLVKR